MYNIYNNNACVILHIMYTMYVRNVYDIYIYIYMSAMLEVLLSIYWKAFDSFLLSRFNLFFVFIIFQEFITKSKK